jgi:hypothetical protein
MKPPSTDGLTVAHRIRECASVLFNALEVIRLARGNGAAITEGLRLAARQAEALARLADTLGDEPCPCDESDVNGVWRSPTISFQPEWHFPNRYLLALT